jgi:hypothetical protein
MKLKGYVVFRHRNVSIFKQDTKQYIPLAFGEKGISEIIACSPAGQFVAVEVKQPGKKPNPDQLAFIGETWGQTGRSRVFFRLSGVKKPGNVPSVPRIHRPQDSSSKKHERWRTRPNRKRGVVRFSLFALWLRLC